MNILNKKYNHQHGFTLLEMMIVIVMIGIMSVWSGHHFTHYLERKKLLQTTQSLVQFMLLIQMTANWQNSTLTVAMAEQDERFCFYLVPKAAQDIVPCQSALRFELPKKEKIHVSYPAQQVIFYGHRQRAAPATIQLHNRVGHTFIVISVQGRIRFCSSGKMPALPVCTSDKEEQNDID